MQLGGAAAYAHLLRPRLAPRRSLCASADHLSKALSLDCGNEVDVAGAFARAAAFVGVACADAELVCCPNARP